MICGILCKALFLYQNIYEYSAAIMVNSFVKFRPLCQMNHSIFQTATSLSEIHCAILCDANVVGPCSRFVWIQDTKSCMLHSNRVYPETSPEPLLSLNHPKIVFEKTNADCNKAGFHYVPETKICIGFKRTTSVTWNMARSLCGQDGADLISLTPKEKLEYVLSYVYCKGRMWVGLKGSKWLTGEEFDNYGYGFRFNNMDGQFPNDPEQNCTMLAPSDKDLFHDESCNIRPRTRFLCEVIIT